VGGCLPVLSNTVRTVGDQAARSDKIAGRIDQHCNTNGLGHQVSTERVQMSQIGHELQAVARLVRLGPIESSLRLARLSALWSAQAEITLGAENITVKACNPLSPARGNVQVLNGGLDMW